MAPYSSVLISTDLKSKKVPPCKCPVTSKIKACISLKATKYSGDVMAKTVCEGLNPAPAATATYLLNAET